MPLPITRVPKNLMWLDKVLKDFSDRSLELKGYGFGALDEINPLDLEYPYLWVNPTRTRILANDRSVKSGYSIIDCELEILVADKLRSDKLNEVETISDVNEILMSLIAELSQHPYYTKTNVSLVDDIDIENEWEKGDDIVNRAKATFTLRWPFSYKYCGEPVLDIENPQTISVSCLPAYVINSDNSYSTSVGSGLSLTLPDNTIESSGGNFQDTTPAVSPIYVIADVEWVDSDGTTQSSEYGTSIVCSPQLPCSPATITINGSNWGTVSSGGLLDIPILNTGLTPKGSKIGANWIIPNSTGKLNGVQVFNVEAGENSTDKFVKVNSVEVGTWSSPTQTWNINVIQSGTAVGSLVSGNWVIPPATQPSISITASTSTAIYGATVSFTVSSTAITPLSYTFYYVNDVNGNRTSTTQAGATLTLTAIWNGSQTIIVTATDGTTTVSASTSITVSNGMRIPTWILNTAPPGSATGAITQLGDLFGFQNNGGNNGNCYAAGMTGACGVVWQPIGAVVYQFMGLSPNITYAANQQQQLDPAWDWQVCGPLANVQMFVQDNGSYVNLITTSWLMYWWRLDRAAGGTIRLYRGLTPDGCNTLVHTFSLTNTGTLYPKFYDLSGMRFGRAYIYGS